MIQIQIKFTNVRDGNPEDLILFFKDVGPVEVEYEAFAAKDEISVIQILITVLGPWLAERYILDPLAEKLTAWLKAITSLKGKNFKIVVNFRNGQVISFETIRLSDPFIIGRLMQILKSISDLMANEADEISINQVMIVPNGENKTLIIGHQGNRPTHIIDIEGKTILPIKNRNDENPEVAFWEIEQLGLRLEYLRNEPGDHSDEIIEIEHDIKEKVAIWL
jgi:hypothetical protein